MNSTVQYASPARDYSSCLDICFLAIVTRPWTNGLVWCCGIRSSTDLRTRLELQSKISKHFWLRTCYFSCCWLFLLSLVFPLWHLLQGRLVYSYIRILITSSSWAGSCCCSSLFCSPPKWPELWSYCFMCYYIGWMRVR